MPPRALRALAGMMGAFVVFYLQDFKTDVFKTLQILTFKNLSLLKKRQTHADCVKNTCITESRKSHARAFEGS
jgi:hypothetical protein